MTRALPPSASVARAEEGAKLFAPSAERNVAALIAMMRDHAPQSGQAMEIASGTGQHIVAFAAALPKLHWQPSELDPTRRASIDAYRTEASLPNLSPALHLDATTAGWGAKHGSKDLITLTNLLHLISEPEARTLISEAAQALNPNGTLILYGPFKRRGKLISEGDKRFNAELNGADPLIGYKDDLDIIRWLGDAGLTQAKTIDMPANNLAFVARSS
jgi:SAM-dependent methyltransferase